MTRYPRSNIPPWPGAPARILYSPPAERLPDCHIEVGSAYSGGVVVMPVKLLIDRRGRPFGNVIAALRSSNCGAKPAPVYLVAGHHRSWCGGPSACWAVELVPPEYGGRPGGSRA